jgi:serine/threonine protein kinase/Flp pilus assembly protein TadD/TolB-like protein
LIFLRARRTIQLVTFPRSVSRPSAPVIVWSSMATKPIIEQRLGHYSLLERVGEGGMGVVYHARDEHLKREVAIKILPPNVVKDESARHRLRREALTLARLNHPNIGTLHDLSTEGDVDFLVMEYIPGVTLASKLARGPLSESEILAYAIQLASALEEAHRQGVIHRDLKPSNVLVTPAGQVKVLDFGLAQLLAVSEDSDTVTSSGEFSGTLPYLAPEELAESRTFDCRTDLYSFGAVLYEMATGRRAHGEKTVAALLEAILRHEPAPVRSLNPEVSPELEAIITKAMDKNPALRYQSAGELKVDLQRLISGNKVGLLPVAFDRRDGRRRWAIALLVTAVVLSLLLALLTLRGKMQTPVFASPRVVAVLPFDAVGGNFDNHVLCRGLTDLLTTRLTQISKQYGIEVVPAGEVRAQSVNSIETARQKLGVSLVVEGSWDFNGSRVMYSLVDARSRHSLNAEFVQADVRNLFAVEREVADSLLRMMAGELKPETPAPTTADNPPSPDAYQYYVRGVGHLLDYHDVASLRSAITLFDSALERDPKFAAALAGKAEAFWRMYQETKDNNWIPQAEKACHDSLALTDQLAAAHVTLGLIYHGQGKYGDAVNQFRRALTLDATSDAAYRGLAASYEALAENSEAERAYRQAIAMRQDYWGGYSALGAFYAKIARYDDAAVEFRRVIELAPENVRGYSNLGGIYLLQGKNQDAEETLRKSITIEPNYRAYSNLGDLYFNEERYAESAQAFENALQLNNRDPRVWRDLGEAYFWLPEREKAATAYKQAFELLNGQLRVNPRDAKLLIELALCTAMLGKPKEALELARRAQTLSPADPEILFRTAEIHEQSGDHEAALKWLERAAREGYSISDIQRDPTFRGLRENRRYQQLLQQAPARSQ